MRRVHYVLSTHWDREWYQPFQDFRYRLVQLLDRVIAGWEREELCGPFQTDGQAIIIEDYLEVRPEREQDVTRLVKDGRFKVGPWYVLPDEFLVSGKSLVRNLRLGRELARKWGGKPSDAGFLCDMFGHNSQIPQIMAGFGIKGAFVWRGINLLDNRLFIWKGADGTELPTYRFGHYGYCTFASDVRQMDLTAARLSKDELKSRLNAFLSEEDKQIPVGPMLAFDGCDHAEWDPAAYQMLSQQFDQPENSYEIVHSTLDGYLDELLNVKGQISQVISGELREPGLYPGSQEAQWLIPGVDSSRVQIKQANAACQTLLCAWAEPFSAMAQAFTRQPYPQGYLDTAWRWLLQNHPHNSICGCSIDAVHQDMLYRFHQSEGIANRLTSEATRRIAACISGEVKAEEIRVVVFNPLPSEFNQIGILGLEIPTDWPGWSEMTHFEVRPGVKIFDEAGGEVAYQRLGQQLNQPRFRIYDTAFPRGYSVHVVQVALPLRIPALGYTTLTLRPGQPGMPTGAPPSASLVTGHRSMANAFLSVKINVNGSLTLLDRKTGNCYQEVLTFEDTADIGDGWNHGPAANDQAYLSTACHSDIALVSDGPFEAAYRIQTRMRLPARFEAVTGTRSEERAETVVDSLVTLKAGAKQVEVETTVFNTVKDHRLRVLFPSQAGKAQTYLADSPFDVVERPIALRANNHLYREPEVETKPQQNWTAVFDDQRGLAIISPGLFESAVQDTPERCIALTLFRATQRTVFTSGEPGGQVQGELTFRYAIVPLAGTPDRAALFDEAVLLSAGLRSVQLSELDVQNIQESMGRSEITPPSLDASSGFMAVSGPVTMTSLRQTRTGLEVRLFNPNDETARASLSLGKLPRESEQPTHAVWVNFESMPISEPFEIDGQMVSFEVQPKQIRTLCVY